MLLTGAHAPGGYDFFVINFNCLSLHIVITIIPIVILVAKAFDPILTLQIYERPNFGVITRREFLAQTFPSICDRSLNVDNISLKVGAQQRGM